MRMPEERKKRGAGVAGEDTAAAENEGVQKEGVRRECVQKKGVQKEGVRNEKAGGRIAEKDEVLACLTAVMRGEDISRAQARAAEVLARVLGLLAEGIADEGGFPTIVDDVPELPLPGAGDGVTREEGFCASEADKGRRRTVAGRGSAG